MHPFLLPTFLRLRDNHNAVFFIRASEHHALTNPCHCLEFRLDHPQRDVLPSLCDRPTARQAPSHVCRHVMQWANRGGTTSQLLQHTEFDKVLLAVDDLQHAILVQHADIALPPQVPNTAQPRCLQSWVHSCMCAATCVGWADGQCESRSCRPRVGQNLRQFSQASCSNLQVWASDVIQQTRYTRTSQPSTAHSSTAQASPAQSSTATVLTTGDVIPRNKNLATRWRIFHRVAHLSDGHQPDLARWLYRAYTPNGAVYRSAVARDDLLHRRAASGLSVAYRYRVVTKTVRVVTKACPQ